MLDVSHLSETYIVDNGDDYHALKDTANMFHIAVPNIIIYSFENPLIDEAEQIPGYASLPVPVINILLEYGKIFIGQVSRYGQDAPVSDEADFTDSAMLQAQQSIEPSLHFQRQDSFIKDSTMLPLQNTALVDLPQPQPRLPSLSPIPVEPIETETVRNTRDHTNCEKHSGTFILKTLLSPPNQEYFYNGQPQPPKGVTGEGVFVVDLQKIYYW